jgi:glycosyltransferase involved in cell wall biosynthesis
MNPISHLRSALLLNQLVSAIKPDIVHAHFSAAIFTTALARRRHWPTTIGTFQGLSFPLVHGKRALLLKWAESLAASQLDENWVLSDDDLVILRAAAPRAKITKQAALGFGCNLDRFDAAKYSETAHQTLLRTLGLTPEQHVFIFVGRYVYYKGFDLVVRAFLKFVQDQPEARLLLVGARDPLHATGLSADEERRLKEAPQILDLGWQSEVEKYLAISHIMLFPSEREGMPVSVMESLAMGVPVITRDSRGCRDVVRDRVDGIVLSECTVEKLISAMSSLVFNSPLREQLASHALAGRSRCDRQHYIAEQTQIYERILEQ